MLSSDDIKIEMNYCRRCGANYEYSKDKWEMFIRWNDEWDRTNGDDEQERKRDYPFSVPGYLKINSKNRTKKSSQNY